MVSASMGASSNSDKFSTASSRSLHTSSQLRMGRDLNGQKGQDLPLIRLKDASMVPFHEVEGHCVSPLECGSTLAQNVDCLL